MSDKIITQALGNAIVTSIKIADGAITADKIAANSIVISNLSPAIAAQSAGVKITSVIYLSGLSVAGTTGEFCNLTGSGFYNGATVFVANYQCLTYYINSSGLQFKVPIGIAPGTYWIYVKNTDGATAFKPNAIVISTTPTWASPAVGLIATINTQNFVNYSLVATSDSNIAYSLLSGTLPSGLSLSASGNISGTATIGSVPSSPYYFTVAATDLEGQSAQRSFILATQGTVGITSIHYANNQQAATISKSESVIVRGSGFVNGATVTIGTAAPITAIVANSTSLSFTSTGTGVTSGYYNFRITNLNGTFGVINNFFFYSSAPLWVGNTSLPPIESNVSYSTNIYSLGSFISDSNIVLRIVASSNLPAGITANVETGLVSGYTSANSNVVYSFTVSVADSENQVSQQTFTANINPVPNISINTTAGSVVEGGTYTILGNNFSSTANVYFNNEPRPTTRVNSNTLTFTSPFIAASIYSVYVQQGNVQISNSINWLVFESVSVGQAAYTTPGAYSWIAPLTGNVSVVVVGGGGGGSKGFGYNSLPIGGGGGGGLAWVNNIPVEAGKTYSVVVGAGGIKGEPYVRDAAAGGDSYFIDATTVFGQGGGRFRSVNLGGAGGSFVATTRFGASGGGAGGFGGGSGEAFAGGGGGGAGGYAGDGGAGGNGGSVSNVGSNGIGGGGGGGGATIAVSGGGGGGGVGILGQGSNGSGGFYVGGSATNSKGGGGSGGSAGINGGSGVSSSSGGSGGSYGGGGGGSPLNTGNEQAGDGGGGAVRIIYGSNRFFPSTNTSDIPTLSANASGLLAQTTINSMFSKTLVAFNQTGFVYWSVVNGTLPPGMTLTSTSANSATISGMVTGNANVNMYSFAIRISDDSLQRITKFYSIWVADQIFSPNVVANIALIAGGGAGGWGGDLSNYGWTPGGGGGGAGGVLQLTKQLSVIEPVVIGAGGPVTNIEPYVQPLSGSNSSLTIANAVAIGGGTGGGRWLPSGYGNQTGFGFSGGSGGGGGAAANIPVTTGPGGAGTSGQGNSGGNAYISGTVVYGGGGGGAGSPGADGPTGIGGNAITLYGYSVAAGGGGTYNQLGGGGIGGTGAGGGIAGTVGAINTGSGGGGGYAVGQGYTSYRPGAGGSGVALIAYRSTVALSTSGNITQSNGFFVHRLISSQEFYSYNVLTSNQPPIWVSPPTTSSYYAVVGGSLKVSLVTVALSKTITYSVVGTAPTDFVINYANSSLEATNISGASFGNYNFKIMATDINGRSSFSPNIVLQIDAI